MTENSIPLQPQRPVWKPSRYLWSALGLVLVLLLGAGIYTRQYLQTSCEVAAVQEAASFLVIQTKHYDDVYQVATNAFQSTLEAPVVTLQQILMDTQEVAVPVCLQSAKSELLSYMKTVIRALRAYAAQEANETVRALIAESNQYYGNFFTELEAVKQCAPLCLPF